MYYLYVYRCFVFMHICAPCACSSQKTRRGRWVPETGVIDRSRHHVGDRNGTQVLLLTAEPVTLYRSSGKYCFIDLCRPSIHSIFHLIKLLNPIH